MNLIKILVLAIFIISGLSVFGCDKETDEKIVDFGTFESGKYANDYFGFSITLPDSWYVADDETRLAMMQRGASIVAGDDKNMKSIVDAADIESLTLLIAGQLPPGSPAPENPSLMVLAEKVDHLPGIKTGDDYHFNARKTIEMSALDVVFPSEVYEATIDNVLFYVMEMNITVGGIEIKQKQYATILDKYALVIGLIYQSENGLQQLEDILQTVSLTE